MKLKLSIKPEVLAKVRTNMLGSFLPGINPNTKDRNFSENLITDAGRIARFKGRFKIGAKVSKRPRIKDNLKSKRTTLELKVVTEMREIQEACKGHALDVIKAFKEIVDNPVSTDQARISAGLALLDRAYGKSAQTNINANVNTNGKASEVDSKELDKRVREALERVERATRGEDKAPKGEDRPTDIRKLN